MLLQTDGANSSNGALKSAATRIAPGWRGEMRRDTARARSTARAAAWRMLSRAHYSRGRFTNSAACSTNRAASSSSLMVKVLMRGRLTGRRQVFQPYHLATRDAVSVLAGQTNGIENVRRPISAGRSECSAQAERGTTPDRSLDRSRAGHRWGSW